MCCTRGHDHDHCAGQEPGHCGHRNDEQPTLKELKGRRDELDRQIAELESARRRRQPARAQSLIEARAVGVI